MEPSTPQNHLLNAFPHPSFSLISTAKPFPPSLHSLDQNLVLCFPQPHIGAQCTFPFQAKPSFDTASCFWPLALCQEVRAIRERGYKWEKHFQKQALFSLPPAPPLLMFITTEALYFASWILQRMWIYVSLKSSYVTFYCLSGLPGV